MLAAGARAAIDIFDLLLHASLPVLLALKLIRRWDTRRSGRQKSANDIANRTVGVILPVLNEAGILDAALTRVLEQGPDEIVVVDGGSDDADT